VEQFDENMFATEEELQAIEDEVPDTELAANVSTKEAGVFAELDGVGEAIAEDDKGKFDIRCRIGDLQFHAERFADGTGRNKRCYLSIDGADVFKEPINRLEFDTSDRALRQFSSLVDGPAYDFTMKKSPADLIAKVMNAMRRGFTDVPVLLRCRQPKTGPGKKKESEVPYVRAVLRDSYGILDNKDVFSEVRPWANRLGLTLEDLKITDHAFHARFVKPDHTQSIKVTEAGDNGNTDDATVGIHMFNSETGHGKISGDFMLYRLVCSNGLIMLVDGARLFEQTHGRIDRDVFSDRVANGFTVLAKDFGQIIDQFASLKRIQVVDPMATAKELFAIYGVPSKYRQLALEVLSQEHGQESWYNTAFSIVNALTLASQRVADPSERLTLDRSAGRVMRGAWRRHQAAVA
jgi:hypothetical protein